MTPAETQYYRDALRFQFGAEWDALTPTEQGLILRDCEDVEDVSEYRRNIGRGNLAEYVACQRVRFGVRPLPLFGE